MVLCLCVCPQVENAGTSYQQRVEEVERLTTALDSSMRQIEKLHGHYREAEAQLQDMKHLSGLLDARTERVAQLEHQLADLQEALQRALVDLRAKELELAQQKESHGELHVRATGAEQARAAQEQEIEQLKAKLSEAHARIRQVILSSLLRSLPSRLVVPLRICCIPGRTHARARTYMHTQTQPHMVSCSQ